MDKDPAQPTASAPPAHGITTIEQLRQQLYAAMQLEHATIPVYLTAFYSIRQRLHTDPAKPVTNVDVQQILRVIVVEEMLHLTIAANLLNSVGGTVDLTGTNFLPSYPQPLPDGEQDFTVGLGPFSKDLLDMFLKIERPSLATDPSRKVIASRAEQISALAPQPPDQPQLRYYSIGDFYAAIAQAITDLEEQACLEGHTIFTGPKSWQVTSEFYYSGGGTLEAVTDLKSAERSIQLIIEQGEGGQRDPYSNGELAHYYRFQQIAMGRYYMPGDQVCHPTGPRFNVDFESVYPVKPNIRLADYPPGSDLAEAAASFNSAYRDFLALLTRAFGGQPELLLDAVPLMFGFRNQLDVLVRNPLPGTSYHAGPTFELYGPAPPPPTSGEVLDRQAATFVSQEVPA